MAPARKRKGEAFEGASAYPAYLDAALMSLSVALCAAERATTCLMSYLPMTQEAARRTQGIAGTAPPEYLEVFELGLRHIGVLSAAVREATAIVHGRRLGLETALEIVTGAVGRRRVQEVVRQFMGDPITQRSSEWVRRQMVMTRGWPFKTEATT